jgi:hypothetical protein
MTVILVAVAPSGLALSLTLVHGSGAGNAAHGEEHPDHE